MLKIALAGEPVLYQKAQDIIDPTSFEVRTHAEQMIEVLEMQGGLALAAPQVGLSLRMLIINVPQEAPAKRYDFASDPTHKAFPLTVMINPVLQNFSEETHHGWESCLSFPGMRGKVRRSCRVDCRWMDLEGNVHMKPVTGFNARVLQHECDHLDGIVYPARIEDFSTFEVNPN